MKRKKRGVPDDDDETPLSSTADNTDTGSRSASAVRRAISGDNRDLNNYGYGRSGDKHEGRHNKQTGLGGETGGTSLDRLVRDIKKKVSNTRDFWKSLPHAICSAAAAPVTQENNCWNGLQRSR